MSHWCYPAGPGSPQSPTGQCRALELSLSEPYCHVPAWSQATLRSGHNMYLSLIFLWGIKSVKALKTVVSPCHRSLYTEKDLFWLWLDGTTEDSRVVLMLLCGAGILVRLLLCKEGVPVTWVTLKWMYTLTRQHWERRKLKQWNKIFFFYWWTCQVWLNISVPNLQLWICTTALTQSLLFLGVGFLFCVMSFHSIMLFGKNEFRKWICACRGVSWRSQQSPVEITPQNLAEAGRKALSLTLCSSLAVLSPSGAQLLRQVMDVC